MTAAGIMNIAHRGESKFAPQNTIAAFEQAVRVGADAIELDIWFSKDKQLVLIHDATVNRTTDGEGAVSGYTVEELKELDAGSYFSEKFRGERIPTLREVLERFTGRIGLCIEIKDEDEGVEEALVALLDEYDAVKGTTVTSGSYESIARVKALNPAIKVGLLTKETDEDVADKLLAIGAEQICPWEAVLDTETVARLHDRGLEVRAWGVGSDVEKMARMIEIGTDGMTVNDPVSLKRLIDQRAES